MTLMWHHGASRVKRATHMVRGAAALWLLENAKARANS